MSSIAGRRSLALVTALACGAGCAAADATPAQAVITATAQDSLGLNPGETMAFEVQLGGVLVGEAQLAVGELGEVDGRRALVVKSRAATAGAAALVAKMVDEATTVIDVDTGRPIGVETFADMRGKQTTASAKFTGSIAEVTYKRSDRPNPITFKIDFKVDALHDAHSAMAQLRGWKATPGTVRTVHVVGGRRLWRVDVRYAGEETIGSALGNRRAVVYDGVSFRAKRDLSVESTKPARSFKVWLSDDADRVPLKMSAKTELGDVVMTLTEYSRP